MIDTASDEPIWSMHFDNGVRPMTFETNPDGSTKRIFMQITNFHGVYVVDFEKRALVQKNSMPEIPCSQVDNDALQGSPGHGLAVSSDQSMLWSTSKPNNDPEWQMLAAWVRGEQPRCLSY